MRRVDRAIAQSGHRAMGNLPANEQLDRSMSRSADDPIGRGTRVDAGV
jgi:hypothetical protein